MTRPTTARLTLTTLDGELLEVWDVSDGVAEGVALNMRVPMADRILCSEIRMQLQRLAGPGDQGGHWTMDEQAQHDARLIAAAPRIYDALAAVEWGGRGFVDYETDYAACPACGGYDPSDLAEGSYYYEENKDYIGHRDGCQLAAALAQARGEDA